MRNTNKEPSLSQEGEEPISLLREALPLTTRKSHKYFRFNIFLSLFLFKTPIPFKTQRAKGRVEDPQGQPLKKTSSCWSGLFRAVLHWTGLLNKTNTEKPKKHNNQTLPNQKLLERFLILEFFYSNKKTKKQKSYILSLTRGI